MCNTQRDRLVIVKGIAGLGNRLRVVTAAMEYADKTDRTIYVDWKDGMFAKEGVNAFNKYFQIVEFPHISDSMELCVNTYYPAVYKNLPMDNGIYNYFEKGQMKNRYIRKVCHYAFKILHKLGDKSDSIDDFVSRLSESYQYWHLTDEYKQKFGQEGRFAFGAHLKRNIEADAIIYCDNIPFYSQSMMRKHIELRPEIQKRVDAFVKEKELADATVGVHVRASGKKCYGDLQKFIAKLKVFNRENGIKRVFLCTDNAETEDLFRREFPQELVVQDKFIPEIHEGETGIHDFAQNSRDEELQSRLTDEAVIDMFSLAKTTYLFYQMGSTFSEISKVYHNAPENCRSWMSL